MSFKHYLIAFRAHAQLMTLSAIFTYFCYARYSGVVIGYKGFVYVCIATVLFHLSVNSIAEYRDFERGIDSKESKGESTIPLMLINNPKKVYRLGLCCFVLAVIFGMLAVYSVGKILLIPGVLSGILVFTYSEWPFRYKYKALGELAVFLLFGPVLAYSCSYSLLGYVETYIMIISIPIGLLVANVMLANNIRDYQFDVKVFNKTLPTVCGLKFAYGILFSMVHISYLVLLFLPIPNVYYVFLTYPIVCFSVKYINRHEFFNVFLILQFAFSLSLSAIILLAKSAI